MDKVVYDASKSMGVYLEGMKKLCEYRKELYNPTYCCIEEFVMENGREFEAPGRWPDEPAQRGPMGQCFMNATSLALHSDLAYVEGYAVKADLPFPLLHAWCVDEAGSVIDPTWGDGGLCYYGVCFSDNYLKRIINERGYYGLLDVYEIGFPLIRGSHKYLGDGQVLVDGETL